MLRVDTPIVVIPTRDARVALGRFLPAAARMALREIAITGKGLEIAHLQFTFSAATLAVCSRVRRDGVVEIEIGLGNPRLPKSSFTNNQIRAALAAIRKREEAEKRAPKRSTVRHVH